MLSAETAEHSIYIIRRNFVHPVGPKPARQWLPYQGSCRAEGVTERFVSQQRFWKERSAKASLREGSLFHLLCQKRRGHSHRLLLRGIGEGFAVLGQ